MINILEAKKIQPEAQAFSFTKIDGNINCRLHHSAEGEAAILWIFGAGGGFGGPAGGVYERLADDFQSLNVASLQLDYRRPGYFADCYQDVLQGVQYLKSIGKNRIILVGHSFGGAVAISAGISSSMVIAVAALSSQTKCAENVRQLSPKPLLLIHGSADEILPDSCSIYIYALAQKPKDLILYPAGNHGLDHCRTELDRDLKKWLKDVLRSQPNQSDRNRIQPNFTAEG